MSNYVIVYNIRWSLSDAICAIKRTLLNVWNVYNPTNTNIGKLLGSEIIKRAKSVFLNVPWKISRLAFLATLPSPRQRAVTIGCARPPTPGTHFPPYVKSAYGFPERNQGGRDNRDCFPSRHEKKNVTRWFRFSVTVILTLLFFWLAPHKENSVFPFWYTGKKWERYSSRK